MLFCKVKNVTSTGQNLKASLLKVSITDSRSDGSNIYMYNQFCKQHANVSTTWFLTKKKDKN